MKELTPTQQLRLDERLRGILQSAEDITITVNRMLKNYRYVNAQFLQMLTDNANSIKILTEQTIAIDLKELKDELPM